MLFIKSKFFVVNVESLMNLKRNFATQKIRNSFLKKICIKVR